MKISNYAARLLICSLALLGNIFGEVDLGAFLIILSIAALAQSIEPVKKEEE